MLSLQQEKSHVVLRVLRLYKVITTIETSEPITVQTI